MSYEIECEKRILIEKEDYFSILKDIRKQHKNVKFLFITNYYLDTDDRSIIKNRSVLRIRTISGHKKVLTLKIAGTNGDKEHHQELTYYSYKKCLNGCYIPKGNIKEQLLKIGVDVNKISCFGNLKTKRLEIKNDNHLLVLDLNQYNNIVDYNLEIEAKDMKTAESVFEYYLNKFSINAKNDHSSKSSRFFKTL